MRQVITLNDFRMIFCHQYNAKTLPYGFSQNACSDFKQGLTQLLSARYILLKTVCVWQAWQVHGYLCTFVFILTKQVGAIYIHHNLIKDK